MVAPLNYEVGKVTGVIRFCLVPFDKKFNFKDLFCQKKSRIIYWLGALPTLVFISEKKSWSSLVFKKIFSFWTFLKKGQKFHFLALKVDMSKN